MIATFAPPLTPVEERMRSMFAGWQQDPEPVPRTPWRDWLDRYFSAYITAPFGERHVRFWSWMEALEPGTRPRPRVEVWPRGGGKSTTIELACAWIGSQPQPARRFVLYVSETQAQADRHIQAIAGMLEHVGIDRAVNEFGASKGWKRTEIRAANGFNAVAFGLDSGMRGAKLDEVRPDLIVMDDIDGRHDTPATTRKKIEIITETILPAGSVDRAVIIVQNKIHKDSIVAQLTDGRADFLHDREPPTVEPAIRDLDYVRVPQPDGSVAFRITRGTPTWEGQSITVCEGQLTEWGETAFRREAQHEVDRVEHGKIDLHWFGTIRPGERYLSIVDGWDTAFGTGPDADYSVCVTIGVTAWGYDVLQVWRDRVAYPALRRAAISQATWVAGAFPGIPYTVAIENKASGQSLIQTLREETRLAVIAEPASRRDEKVRRVEEVTPILEAGKVNLPRNADWLHTFTQELSTFTGDGDGHDDQVDAFTIALRRAAGIGHASGMVEDESAFAEPDTGPDSRSRRRPPGPRRPRPARRY